MDMENTHGMIIETTKVNTLTIKNMAMGSYNGLMVGHTRVTGTMVNSMG